MDTVVIYHGGCRDGFCAAWVINRAKATGPVTYHPGFYGQAPPDVKGKNVIIVDFCYPTLIMLEILEDSNSLVWLDHHKTAEGFAKFCEDFKEPKLQYRFQNDKSGAGLAWDYFFPNEPRPWLVNYVEDRDLWAKRLLGTDQVNAYIACLKFDFNIWDKASQMLIAETIGYGTIAEAKTEQYVREVCKNVYFKHIGIPTDMVDINKTLSNIPIVNICQVDCSEVLHELCKKYPESAFSLYWFKRADGMYQYGLRSIGDFDVSAVAKIFGGGGHKNAAGFQLDYLLDELQ